jgi:hypothetical protein
MAVAWSTWVTALCARNAWGGRESPAPTRRNNAAKGTRRRADPPEAGLKRNAPGRAPRAPPPHPPQALKTLWSQGGVPRFYQGLLPALIQVRRAPFGITLPPLPRGGPSASTDSSPSARTQGAGACEAVHRRPLA